MNSNLSISSKPKRILIPRITQLDANEFDNEIRNILSNQIFEIANLFKMGCLSNFRSEITFFLNLVIFKYSVFRNNSTFGQDLLGLKYSTKFKKSKALLYLALKYFFPYLQTKYEDNFGRIENIKILNLLKKVEAVIKLSKLLNTLIFLKEGKYPTVTDRLLKLKYVPADNFNRNIAYSFMIRQLLWHGFMELLIHVVPLINFKIIKRQIKNFLFPNSSQKKVKMHVKHNAQTKCVICHQSLNLPCIISMYCPHLACYYCISNNTLKDEKYLCPECDEPYTISKAITFL